MWRKDIGRRGEEGECEQARKKSDEELKGCICGKGLDKKRELEWNEDESRELVHFAPF